MAKAKPWYSDPRSIVPVLVGCVALGGGFLKFFIADAMQTKATEDLQEEVDAIQEENKSRDGEINQTAVQYQLIQQQLGVVVESLKELKSKR